jgi:hypothetical protein
VDAGERDGGLREGNQVSTSADLDWRRHARLRRIQEIDGSGEPRDELFLGQRHEDEVARARPEAVVALRGLIALEHGDDAPAARTDRRRQLLHHFLQRASG